MPNSILADVLMHPQRLKIVAALMRLGPSTASDLAKALHGLPAATLYRHLGSLTDAGLVEIKEERRVRGTVERTYAIDAVKARLGAEALNDLAPAEAQAFFGMFLALLAGQFEDYSQRDGREYARDQVMFAIQPVLVSPDRADEFVAALSKALEPFAVTSDIKPTHTFAFVSLPSGT